MNWIDLARDTNRWRALVNAAMDRRFPKKCREYLGYLRTYLLLKKHSAPLIE